MASSCISLSKHLKHNPIQNTGCFNVMLKWKKPIWKYSTRLYFPLPLNDVTTNIQILQRKYTVPKTIPSWFLKAVDSLRSFQLDEYVLYLFAKLWFSQLQMHSRSIPSPCLRKNYLKCCFSTRRKGRLKAVRNFIIHCNKKEAVFWQTVCKHRSTLNPF